MKKLITIISFFSILNVVVANSFVVQRAKGLVSTIDEGTTVKQVCILGLSKEHAPANYALLAEFTYESGVIATLANYTTISEAGLSQTMHNRIFYDESISEVKQKLDEVSQYLEAGKLSLENCYNLK